MSQNPGAARCSRGGYTVTPAVTRMGNVMVVLLATLLSFRVFRRLAYRRRHKSASIETGGIAMVNGPDAYVANALSMWCSLASTIPAPNGVLGVVVPDGHRYVVRRPLAPADIAALLEAVPSGVRAVVEDSYGVGPVPVNASKTVLRMPVMNRRPESVMLSPRADVTVAPVAEVDTLARRSG